MNIKVGEYIRTKKGQIYIADKITENGIIMKDSIDIFKNGEQFGSTICEEKEIKTHSFCIIDLIEIGDYVNGYKVISINKEAPNNDYEGIELDRNNNYEYQFISKNKVKSILTKEQYKRNCYKVEG